MPCLNVDILIVGLNQDFVLKHLVKVCEKRKLNVKAILMEPDNRPAVYYDIGANKFFIEGAELIARSAFMRADMYLNDKDYTPRRAYEATVWYSLFHGYFLASPQIKIFNRTSAQTTQVNKALALRSALKFGLHVAPTAMTNSVDAYNSFLESHEAISKALTNGGFCEEATRIDECGPECILSRPVTLQKKLKSPEMRLFRVGEKLIPIRVESSSLDYRLNNDAILTRMESVPEYIEESFMKLCDAMALNFCAADFKMDPDSGRFAFLEVNDNPMFSVFDKACNFEISSAILDYLTS